MGGIDTNTKGQHGKGRNQSKKGTYTVIILLDEDRAASMQISNVFC
jgi:hypothetical protein